MRWILLIRGKSVGNPYCYTLSRAQEYRQIFLLTEESSSDIISPLFKFPQGLNCRNQGISNAETPFDQPTFSITGLASKT